MKQTTKRSLRLYETLTPKQQAALTFQLLAEQNAEEAVRVHDAAAWRYGRFKDATYTEWRDRFQNVCMIVGIEYWRLNCHRHAVMLAMAENLDLEPEYVKKISARLASLQAVLQDLCVQHGFDHSAALTLAGVPKQGTTDNASDSNYYQDWLNNLNDCLPRK